jgi:putative FmdB family regulatory protein
MPLYSYKCLKCGESFDSLRNISEIDSPIDCIICGSKETKRIFDAGDSVSIIYKGWDWGDKCRKFGRDRTRKNEKMKSVQKDYYGNDTFVDK